MPKKKVFFSTPQIDKQQSLFLRKFICKNIKHSLENQTFAV